MFLRHGFPFDPQMGKESREREQGPGALPSVPQSHASLESKTARSKEDLSQAVKDCFSFRTPQPGGLARAWPGVP